ncbi:precorrin-6y C5,15-methyltransferase (decarboxylating) subunit CbiE [Roseobacter sp. HKCCD9010]|uniref:precorrin-6y C5,15-methyltransferase (decarboxylating) subunit CbiE n=1 Tax=unclassified Roseobacter TaxID=196798 RepID=UPI001490C971|nr:MULTISPECIES: precorrin-6y C5,15-methyltransferase (decarboxylating) subunit CbiE [unclassified Roseobacter]MBF9051946.1 precorrin-6y C5,15-methyltransferase (decarboxylating) subunit CbiE [Rhodobacterales bacterium HKCCD4356]NNV13939.1 precorrin-6y C5,15-methyltransferase (decarboxylating) subunit CbiE [Roseobacter sp. HKCCD7357]NNV18111.1 precorrin-6y C5,15-methyltransferase (decarboxylating) subunit CbiE [Roseobacter sp. HKCCD8768]NNV27571.1 precorrin-6y C5,15-methyltransferase (decarboxy
MAEAPSKKAWLIIVGLGEDGLDGLPTASRDALVQAEVVMGAKRHLDLLTGLQAETIEWPVPFADGLPMLYGQCDRKVVVLASGDPFWFGAGSVIAKDLDPDDWQALPGPSTFSLAAARLGWSLEKTLCLGLHAVPISRLKPHLAPGVRCILLLRDGDAVASLARYVAQEGFGSSDLIILEALGGPRERLTKAKAEALPDTSFAHPVAVAVSVAGPGGTISATHGIDDSFFETDGQITKRPIRALALSALAPKPFETLWDIGGGSGSIAIEWLLAHPTTEALSIEPRLDRAARIRANSERLGVDRLRVIEGSAPEDLDGMPPPHAVFIGGGLSEALLTDLTTRLSPGTRLVAHAVTLESEALLSTWSERLGGNLMRIALSDAAALGIKRGWKAAYPVVQWRVVL